MTTALVTTRNDSGTSTPAVARTEGAWLAIREMGKEVRMDFTDAVKAFTEYVDDDGKASEAPAFAYSNFTRSVYRGFGLNKRQRELLDAGKKGRSVFNASELLYLQMAEMQAARVIQEGIAANVSRAAIKERVRAECDRVAEGFNRLHVNFFDGDDA